MLGVGADADGQPVLYAASCRDNIDSAILYSPDDPKGADSDHALKGRWTLSRETRAAVASWPIKALTPATGSAS